MNVFPFDSLVDYEDNDDDEGDDGILADMR